MELTQEIIDIAESRKWDEDIRQEVYLVLLESEDLVPPKDKDHLKNFLNKVYHLVLKNMKFKNDNRARLLIENEDTIRANLHREIDGFAADPCDIHAAVEGMQGRLEDLSYLNRQTLQRLYLDGLTPDELAAEEGVERNAIDQRVHNIKKILKGED